MIKQILVISAIFYLFWACSEETPPPTDNFVVEAFITANAPVNDIKIKGTSPILSPEVTNAPLANAIINLSKSTGAFSLTYNASTERYEYTGVDLEILPGESFEIDIQVGNRNASGSTLVPSPPSNVNLTRQKLVIPQLALTLGLRDQIVDLFENERTTLSWTPVTEEKYFVVIEHRVAGLDPILPSAIPDEVKNLLGSFRFISEPSTDPNFDIIGVALETYGPHVAKVFTVNQEYVDLFENVEQDSRDLNEPPSNITNALGIFTAFAVDSVLFEVVRE